MSALAPERVRPAPRPKPAPPRLHLITRVTPAVRVSRAPKTPFVILLLVLLAGGLLGLLLLNTVIDQDAFTLHDLQSKQTALDVQEASLHETADDDADPAVLASKAAALGMVPAGPPTFVKFGKLLKGGTLVGNLYIVMGKPTPAPVAAPVVAATPVPTTPAVATPAVATPTPGTTAKSATPARSATTTRTATTRTATTHRAVTASTPTTPTTTHRSTTATTATTAATAPAARP